MNRRRVGVCLAVSAAAAAVFAAWPRSEGVGYYFEVTMRASNPASARFYPDINAPLDDANCQQLQITRPNTEQTLRFTLKDGRYLNFRFSPADVPGTTVNLTGARIVTRAGRTVTPVAAESVKPLRNVDIPKIADGPLAIRTTSADAIPLVGIELGSPLILKTYAEASRRTLLRRLILTWLITASASLLLAPLIRFPLTKFGSLVKDGGAWLTGQPARFIVITAVGTVVLSCYPVVFFGKSFLSPNNNSHTRLLYGEMPTVPGSSEAKFDIMTGSDLGAAMWYSWPTSVVESRALFHDFELPLWNRYDSGGLPLLGQGQSMLGDPLHLLALCTRGSPLSWDLKYLLAKFIFAASLGFCVWQLTKHLPAAIFVTATSAFIGFFGYRYSHPAFFSLCYAPSVLLCWLKLLESASNRSGVVWTGLLVLGNWALLNSGTVKEAYILLLALNACGFLTLLLGREVERKAEKLRRGLFSFFLFSLIATPVWLTFLDTLGQSWTAYDAGAVFQLKPSLLVGLFDDIFYRHLNPDAPHVVPSANFLILVAILWLCATRAKIDRRHLSLGIWVTCLAALAFVFGIVPSSVIFHLPFINRIYHIDNTFSCVAIVCLLILAGFGIKAFYHDVKGAVFCRSYVAVLLLLGGLLAFYFGIAATRSTGPDSRFFWTYCAVLVIAAAIVPWPGAWLVRKTKARLWLIISAGVIFFGVSWRHGMHLDAPFRADVMNPQPRTDLSAHTSAALKLIRGSGAAAEPFRSVGLKYNLFPGYGGAVGIEQIDGPDPLLNKHYKSLMEAAGIVLPFGGARAGEVNEPLADSLPLFDMLNVRYVLGSAGGNPELAPSLPKIAALDLDVYESRKVWPRAFFTNHVASYGSESEFVRLLKDGDGAPFAAVAQADLDRQEALSKWRVSASPTPMQTIRATDYALTTNTTSFKMKAPGPGIVVLTEPYLQDDFQLRVNGKPNGYFRVNSAFRGVFIPASGDYEISYSYWPRHFTMSLWISALGLFSLLIFLGIEARRTPRRQHRTEPAFE